MALRGVLTGLDAIHRPPPRAVVTVGVFDGVHRAHQTLISTTVQLARRLHGTSVAVTFHPDPHVVLNPTQAHPALMPVDARVAFLRALGLDVVWVIPFTKRFAQTTAEQFVRRILLGRLRAVAIVVGEAFVFGRNRQGGMPALQTVGRAQGMRVVSVAQVRSGGAPISSSRIRRLISRGALAQAKQLLGRPAELYGVVVRGVGRGRRLGFPTANIQLTSQVFPPQGVYAVVVHSRRLSRTWRGVMNLGVRPTFGPGPLVCEVYLLGFTGRLLGELVTIALLARLRAERCFDSPRTLAAQIRRDVRRARRLFARSSLA